MHLNPGTQEGAQHKDLGAVLQMDLTKFPSVAQATNTTGIFFSHFSSIL